jgi:hypothetical protein
MIWRWNSRQRRSSRRTWRRRITSWMRSWSSSRRRSRRWRKWTINWSLSWTTISSNCSERDWSRRICRGSFWTRITTSRSWRGRTKRRSRSTRRKWQKCWTSTRNRERKYHSIWNHYQYKKEAGKLMDRIRELEAQLNELKSTFQEY